MKTMHVDFVGNRKKYLLVPLVVITVGLLVNILFGTKMDIQFTGGSIVTYSYVGDVHDDDVKALIQETTGTDASLQFNYDVYLAGEETPHNSLSAEFSKSESITTEIQKKILSALQEKYPDAEFEQIESNTVNPTMGSEFFWKCMVAVALASLLMLVYVAFRFKKIGGWSAGLMALLALLNDVLVAYFAFVIFRIPLDDNFVAVILSILGYSLNDTIVIYDRIRENRRAMGPKSDLGELVNLSINQSFGRTLNTSIATFLAVACVTVVALIYSLESILSFSIPMMFGIVSGFYTSVFLTAPMWVALQGRIAKRRAAKRAAAKK